MKAAESTLSQLFAPLILLHLYPRALIQLTLQTISYPSTTFNKPFSTDPSLRIDDKGKGKELEAPRGTGVGAGEKAARINAAIMALVDAGVQCRGMLVAVAIAFVPVQEGGADEEEMRLDPTPKEEEEATSTHVFAFSFGQGVGGTEGTCVGVDSVGTFSEDQVRSVPSQLASLLADNQVMSSSSTRKTSPKQHARPSSPSSARASRPSTASRAHHHLHRPKRRPR